MSHAGASRGATRVLNMSPADPMSEGDGSKTQLNRLETERSRLIRLIASASSGAMVS